MPTRTCLQTENAKLYEHRQKPSNVKCSGHLPEALMQDRPRQLTSNSCIYRSVAQVPGYENKYLGGSGGTHEIPPRAPMLLPTPAFQFPTSVFPRPVVPQITWLLYHYTYCTHCSHCTHCTYCTIPKFLGRRVSTFSISSIEPAAIPNATYSQAKVSYSNDTGHTRISKFPLNLQCQVPGNRPHRRRQYTKHKAMCLSNRRLADMQSLGFLQLSRTILVGAFVKFPASYSGCSTA